MKDAKEFRLSFYQGVCDDPNELTPCDDSLCIAGVSHHAIEYFANCAEAEYELALEAHKAEIESLHAEIRQRDNQIKLLSEKLKEALNARTVRDREGNPNPPVQRDSECSKPLPFIKDGSGRLIQNPLSQQRTQDSPNEHGDASV